MRNYRSRPKISGATFAIAPALIFIAAASLCAQRMSERERNLRDREAQITMMESGASGVKRNPKREPHLLRQQISEDFRNLQGLNNKMMAEAWARTELDYRYISEMISQIRGKATRLQSNLALPESKDDVTKQSEASLSDASKFRAALLQLDRHIMSFATNPLFQKPNVIEVELANQASRDLAAVVELSGKLKKVALKLGQPSKTSP